MVIWAQICGEKVDDNVVVAKYYMSRLHSDYR